MTHLEFNLELLIKHFHMIFVINNRTRTVKYCSLFSQQVFLFGRIHDKKLYFEKYSSSMLL